ncbi:MAG: glucose-1-phosphate adenylyltransferase [Gammaproteobacteria bacterium]
MKSYRQRLLKRLARDTLGLVMAGGRGTRLGALTSHRVKPAVPFGGKFRLIDFPLSNCINSGIRRIGVLTQYKSHSLIRHLQSGWSFLHGEFGEYIELLPAQQRTGKSWYEGTADSVYQNMDIIMAQAPKWVLVLGGDHVYKMDYSDLLKYHVVSGAELTVGCVDVPVKLASEFGVVEADSTGRVTAFKEKPAVVQENPGHPGYVFASMGIYVFNKDYLLQTLTEDAADQHSSHDFGKDILPKALVRGDRLYGFLFRDIGGNHRGYWRDIGNLDAYWQANLELTEVTPPLDLYDNDWPIWTYQLQAPPCKFVFDEEGRRGMAVDSMLAGGCIVSGAQLRRSVVFPFVRIEEGTIIEDSIILPNAVIGKHCSIRRAVIETGCQIPDGSTIGKDLEEDRLHYEVSPGGITLVTPEMLNQTLSYVR